MAEKAKIWRKACQEQHIIFFCEEIKRSDVVGKNEWGETNATLFCLISVGYHSELRVAILFYPKNLSNQYAHRRM